MKNFCSVKFNASGASVANDLCETIAKDLGVKLEYITSCLIIFNPVTFKWCLGPSTSKEYTAFIDEDNIVIKYTNSNTIVDIISADKVMTENDKFGYEAIVRLWLYYDLEHIDKHFM